MFEHLRHIAIFSTVIDEGTFRGAAQKNKIAPSRVSEMVSELEDYLGVTLLYRTTRKIALTHEGRLFYLRAKEMLHSVELGINEVNALSNEPVGSLRISAPAFLANSKLTNSISHFIQKHPLVNISLSYTDHVIDLIDSGLDISIRAGWLDDSSMMSLKIGEEKRKFIVGMEYGASLPTPKELKDLEEWDWIRYTQRSDTTEATYINGETQRVHGNTRIEVDNLDSVYAFAKQNLGVTILPNYLANLGIKKGDFIEVLSEWKLRPLGYYAVWPNQSKRESLTRQFVRFIADDLANKKSQAFTNILIK